MTAILYQDFDLSIEANSSDPTRYRARVSSVAAGQASGEFMLSFSDQALEILFLRLGRPRRGVRAHGSPEMQAAQAFGSQLFATVFTGPVQSAFMSSLNTARQQNQGLRIRLRLSDAPALADLPWEFLYDPTHNHFLAYSNVTPLVRYLDLPHTVTPLAVQPPLKVLVMIANPRDHGYSTLDVEEEWHKVQGALAGLEQRGLLQVTRLEAATLSALQRQLRHDQYHIFHFVGHGGFDNQTQSGVLLLEDEQGRSRMVSGHYLGALLRDHFSLRLALLNACEGARTSRSDPFAGVAQHLVQQGIPAVIAMQFEITDQAAIRLSYEFYNALADNYGVDAALSEARKAIYAHGNDIEWGTPVLYMRAQRGELFDLALPSQSATKTESPAKPIPTLPKQQPVSDIETATPDIHTKKHKWWRIGLGLLSVAGLLYLSVYGYQSWQTEQRQAVTATAIAHAVATTQAEEQMIATAQAPLFQATAAAITSSDAGKLMLEKAPQLRPLIEKFGMTFVEVPGGDFLMGSTKAQFDEAVVLCNRYYGDGDDCQRSWYTDELQQLKVSVNMFWIMQTEVTNAQYRAFVAADGYDNEKFWGPNGWQWRQANGNIVQPRFWGDVHFNGDEQPVVGISWYEAMAYARWLTDEVKLNIRLPTEAEWEKAARGPEGLVFPWGDGWDDSRVNYCDKNCDRDQNDRSNNDGYAYTAPVDSYANGKSFYGTLNMAGNVWEWTSSLNVAYPYNIIDGRENETATGSRVVRGGSWYLNPHDMRTANRSRFAPDSRDNGVGIRLVVALQ